MNTSYELPMLSKVTQPESEILGLYIDREIVFIRISRDYKCDYVKNMLPDKKGQYLQ